MRSIFSRIYGTAVLAAVGGGLASAILSMLTVQKTSLALAMSCIAPFPVMLAALSFGPVSGFCAALVGALAVGLLDAHPGGLTILRLDQLGSAGTDVLVYAVSLGLPAWLLARLASATRLAGVPPATADERKLGLIIASTAGFAAISVALDFGRMILSHGGFQATMERLSAGIEPYVQNLLESRGSLPNGITIHELAVGVTYAQMPIQSAATLILLGFNIWAAARIAKLSGHLRSPWPDLPHGLRVPRPLALVLAVTLGLSFAGGIPGMLALIATGALVMAFAVQGVALVHDLTRGKRFRTLLLVMVYASLFLFMPWLIAFFALIGLGDAGFSFRDRRLPAAPGKP